MKHLKSFAVFIAGCFILLSAYTSYAGFVLVQDRTGQVEEASIVGFHGGRALVALPGGRYFGIPPYDGAVEVQCADGSTVTGGHAARGHSTFLYVTGEGTCGAIA